MTGETRITSPDSRLTASAAAVRLRFRRCVGVTPRLDESTVISLISAVPDVNDSAIAVPSITVAPELPSANLPVTEIGQPATAMSQRWLPYLSSQMALCLIKVVYSVPAAGRLDYPHKPAVSRQVTTVS